MNTVRLPFYARLALILLAVVLVLFLLTVGRTIFIPLLFALFISVLLLPLTHFLERWHMGRSMAAMISILLFVVVIGTVIFFLSQQVVNFSKDIPLLQVKLTDALHDLQHWIARNYHINKKEQTDYINKSTTSVLSTVANSLGNVFLSVTEILLWVLFIIIYTFFILFHRKLLKQFILALFRPEYRAEVAEVLAETRSVINSYIVGLLIEMALVAVAISSVLAILGIPYAFFIGILVAVLNIIPYIGNYSATVIAMFITYADGNATMVLETAIVLIIIHILDANVLMPRIVGGRVKMNPFITIVAVIIGNLIWGVPGMFLFIPLTGIVKIISERVESLKPWAILIGEEVKEKPGK
jgi:predicted PurR-regulated permease PerM